MTDLQFIMEFLLSEKLTVRLLQNISSGADPRIMMEILAELNISKIFIAGTRNLAQSQHRARREVEGISSGCDV